MTQVLEAETADLTADARRWFVEMLDEAPPAARVIAWRAWLDEDSRHLEAYDAVAAVWDLAGEAQVAPPTAEELARDHYHGRVAVASWRRTRPALRLVAGGVAVAAIATVAFVIASRQNAVRRNPGSNPTARTAKPSRRKLNRSA
jgi:ferric-dicitrate binding protein FerR (iron transport regulator)